MKQARKWLALLLSAALLCGVLCGCGGKKVEAGDYTGSVSFNHKADVMVPALGGGEPTQQTVEAWGANVTITIDEEGMIWNVQANAPEGKTMTPAFMAWTVFGGKFLGSITGNYTCKQMMDITVDVEDDGFPVLTGDCSGIHQPEGMNLTLLYDHEAACAMIILAIQSAITENNLA